ncbi:hypothetical protein ACFPYJ_28485 [Paenibacillus solisilvae]|uniref:DUF429 domain-containing protein n=1 Tax=Paenibacillus solisilvae TaxID=2486751 RepID=A0ABW0W7B3_9BACL
MFERYIGIDYSGKGLPRQKHTAIQIFESTAAEEPCRAWGRSSWSREGVHLYLAESLEAQRAGRQGAMIVGMDHGLSFPLSYFQDAARGKPVLRSYDEFLTHFDQHWGGVKELPVSAIQSPTLPYRNPTELRLTEKFTSSAKSVLNLNPTLISVAFSTHAGIPWLCELRRSFGDVLHVWPYDGLIPADNKSVIAEVYPSLLYSRYTYPEELVKRDEKDAYAVSQWLREQDAGGTLCHYMSLLTLTSQQRDEIVPLEGWILGVL